MTTGDAVELAMACMAFGLVVGVVWSIILRAMS